MQVINPVSKIPVNEKKETKNLKGRHCKPREIRELVIQIAKLSGFGYTRILGELRKLVIKKIRRETIRNILKEEGIEPEPDRTSDTWDEFIKRHVATLWGYDFFSVKAVTAKGIQTLFILAFLNLKTREVVVSKSTAHPDSAWVVEQSEAFLDQTMNREKKPSIILHDLDTKFTKEFTAKMKDKGVRTNPLPKASPNLNGRVICKCLVINSCKPA